MSIIDIFVDITFKNENAIIIKAYVSRRHFQSETMFTFISSKSNFLQIYQSEYLLISI